MKRILFLIIILGVCFPIQAQKNRDWRHQIQTLIETSNHELETQDEGLSGEESPLYKLIRTFEGRIAKTDGVRQQVERYYHTLVLQRLLEGNPQKKSTLKTETNPLLWNAEQLDSAVVAGYETILAQADLLKRTQTADFRPLMTEADKDHLRPTLYDVVAGCYLDFLNSYRRGRTAEETRTARNRSQGLYTELLAFHAEDSDPLCRLYLQMQRILSSNSWQQNDSIVMALQRLADGNLSHPYAAEILREAASRITYTGGESTVDSTNCHKVALLRKAIRQVPKGKWTDACRTDLEGILAVEVNLSVQTLQPLGLPIPLTIRHRNTGSINLVVEQLEAGSLDLAEKINKGTRIVQKDVALGTFEDYNTHSTILPLETLSRGFYRITAKAGGEKTSVVFQVSDVVYVIYPTGTDSLLRVQFLHATTGLALAGEAFTSESLSGTTDKAGCVMWSVGADRKTMSVLFQFPNIGERCLVRQSASGNYRIQLPKTRESIQFLTDRTIYRPGQTIQFKALATQTEGCEHCLWSGRRYTVCLWSDKGEAVDSLTGTTNEYGSFSGRFAIPSSASGGWQLKVDDLGQTTIQIESYKRPRFEIELQKPTDIYALGDSVHLRGVATTYSGLPLDGAVVRYTVTRHEPYSWHRKFRPAEDEVILTAEVKTDGRGAFVLPFKATPTEERTTFARRYQYKVEVDVTDATGETHSSRLSLTLSDIPLDLTLKTTDSVAEGEKMQVRVGTTNLQGVSVPTTGTLVVTRMTRPDAPRIMLPERTSDTDYNLLARDEFIRLFPHLPYPNEDFTFSKPEAVVLQRDFSTPVDTLIMLEALKPGHYQVEGYCIYGSDTVRQTRTFVVNSPLHPEVDLTNFLSLEVSDKDARRGSKTLIFRSALPQATVYYCLAQGTDLPLSPKRVDLKNGEARIEVKAPENGRCPYCQVAVVLVYQGASKVIQKTLDFTPKESHGLRLVTETFRDRLQPGGEETWTFLVTDTAGKPCRAEVAATMYDASLDAISRRSGRSVFNFHLFNQLPSLPNLLPWQNRNGLNLWQQTQYGSLYAASRLQAHYYTLTLPTFADFGLTTSYWGSDHMVFATMTGASGLRMAQVKSMNIRIRGKAAAAPVLESAAQNDLIAGMDSDNEEETPVFMRQNLQETAFFLPQIPTDSAGRFSLHFRVPDALTRWNLVLLAHDKDLHFVRAQASAVTQRTLMVTPTLPRFVRQGDRLVLTAKVSSLAEEVVDGVVSLQLVDTLTGRDMTAEILTSESRQPFCVHAGGSAAVCWEVAVPEPCNNLVYRLVAHTNAWSDGEQGILTVLPAKVMVTDTYTAPLQQGSETTLCWQDEQRPLQPLDVTVNLIPNALWPAVTALPTLFKGVPQGAEALFNRYYALSLSAYLIEKTPARDYLLHQFDATQNALQRTEMLEALNRLQQSDGGFAWYQGYSSSPWVTQHLVGALGRLHELLGGQLPDTQTWLPAAIHYLDEYVLREWQKENNGTALRYLDYFQARSYWLRQYPLPAALKRVLSQATNLLKRQKPGGCLRDMASSATLLYRQGFQGQAREWIKVLTDKAVHSTRQGMYWKSNTAHWGWGGSPIATQAELIRAYSLITPKDTASVEEMRLWLLSNRHTSAWSTGTATIEAIHALLCHGTDWTRTERGVSVTRDGEMLFPDEEPQKDSIPGTFTRTYKPDELTDGPECFTFRKSTPGLAYGSLFVRHLVALDSVTNTATGIRLEQTIWHKETTASGTCLLPASTLQVGDIVTLRWVINTDRPLDFVELQTLRSATMEPLESLSGYTSRGGLHFYQQHTDEATNLYFHHIPAGVHVVEQDCRITHAGRFTSPLTTLQSALAPELSTRSGATPLIVR